MKRSKLFWILTGSAVLLLILGKMGAFNTILEKFLPNWEGFSSKPYWDYKQWSWGYGTRVPGSSNNKLIVPSGTITRAQAMAAMLAHIARDYEYLKGLIKRPLKPAQWAALLSFSYNLGTGNADNLIPNINASNNAALRDQWMQYVNAGGEVNLHLVKRRAAEWNLWLSGI